MLALAVGNGGETARGLIDEDEERGLIDEDEDTGLKRSIAARDERTRSKWTGDEGDEAGGLKRSTVVGGEQMWSSWIDDGGEGIEKT